MTNGIFFGETHVPPNLLEPLARVLRGAPGDALRAIIAGLRTEQMRLIVSDLDAVETAKVRGSIYTLEAFDAALNGVSAWWDSVNAKTSTVKEQEA